MIFSKFGMKLGLNMGLNVTQPLFFFNFRLVVQQNAKKSTKIPNLTSFMGFLRLCEETAPTILLKIFKNVQKNGFDIFTKIFKNLVSRLQENRSFV